MPQTVGPIEIARVPGLHRQQGRADRTDAGILTRRRLLHRLMPSHELSIDFVDFRLYPRIFFSMAANSSRARTGTLSSPECARATDRGELYPWRGKAELCRIATDGVRQLRAIPDQPIAQADIIRAPVARQFSPAQSASSAAHCLAKRLGVGHRSCRVSRMA